MNLRVAAMLGAALLASATLSGCVTNRLSSEQIAQFQPGVSTRSDVVARLGEPDSVSTYSDGTILLQWLSLGVLAGGAGHVAILFEEKSGKMIRVTHQTEL